MDFPYYCETTKTPHFNAPEKTNKNTEQYCVEHCINPILLTLCFSVAFSRYACGGDVGDTLITTFVLRSLSARLFPVGIM